MGALLRYSIMALTPLALVGEGWTVAHASAARSENLLELRPLDRRVATVAYRLATRNVEVCAQHAVLGGLVLHNLAQYAPRYRDAARREFKLDDHRPGVQAVVPSGPADLAGVREDDVIESINDVAVPAAPLPGDSSYLTLDDTLSTLEKALEQGPVRLRVRSETGVRDVTIEGAPGCASRVELVPGNKVEAASDGRIAEVSGALVTFVRNDDELAVMIGHEMAHNILRHTERLESAGVRHHPLLTTGRNAARLRASELDADYLGLYLAARAGYDVTVAIGLWKRVGGAQGLELLPSSIYPHWSQRERISDATIAQINAKRAAGLEIRPEADQFRLDIP